MFLLVTPNYKFGKGEGYVVQARTAKFVHTCAHASQAQLICVQFSNRIWSLWWIILMHCCHRIITLVAAKIEVANSLFIH